MELIQRIKVDFEYQDERGTLTQLVRRGYSQVNVVTSKSGIFRGGHYHKLNTEAYYVIKGKCRVTARKDGKEESYVFKEGDFFQIGPYITHDFDYIDDSILVTMYSLGVEMEKRIVMLKLLLINENCGVGSHGKICADIAHEYEANGYEVKYAYGREKRISDDCKKYAIRIGNEFDLYAHGVLTRVFDRHGFGSKRATKKFLSWANEYDPDEIWLHNLHGYYINIELLFEWIKQRAGMKVKWTLHDCWGFTGHCGYFTSVQCERWKEHCYDCPQKKEYPGSYILDNSFNNFERKKRIFSGVKNMTLIVPSRWLADLVGESFLKDYPVEIRYNEVNGGIFKPTDSEFRKMYGIGCKTLILGVANIWSKRKGLRDFIELNSMLDEHYVIVLIGLSKKQIKDLPNDMIGMERTFDQKELAGIYTTADIFLNPSLEETFGMTSLEAHMCGTPTICYEETACAEVANRFGGKVVSKGVENLFSAIIEITGADEYDNENKRQDI